MTLATHFSFTPWSFSVLFIKLCIDCGSVCRSYNSLFSINARSPTKHVYECVCTPHWAWISFHCLSPTCWWRLSGGDAVINLQFNIWTITDSDYSHDVFLWAQKHVGGVCSWIFIALSQDEFHWMHFICEGFYLLLNSWWMMSSFISLNVHWRIIVLICYEPESIPNNQREIFFFLLC